MSLNEIKLELVQLTDWYGSQLVVTAATKPAQTTETQVWVKPPLLGDFKKRTLIIVSEPGHTYLSDQDLNFLTGILGACKLSLGDVGILNIYGLNNQPESWIQEAYDPATCWRFGINSSKIGFTDAGKGAQKVFSAPALSVLSTNPEAKRLLWAALKDYYGV